MTEETGAAAPVDAPQPQGGAGSEQATPEPVAQESAAPDAETPKDPALETESSEDKPKKPSRTERMRRRMQAMATELDGLREQLAARKESPPDDAPKEADFNGDYFAYQAAKTAHEIKQGLKAEFAEERNRQATERLHRTQQEMVEDFEERSEDFRARIPDFDDAIGKFVAGGGKFSPALVEELHQSEMGPALAYQLAKNPQLANSLNSMSPREVAREIGRLEAKASLPNPKKQTSAPPPLRTPSGGASQPADLRSLAKSDDASAYITARRQAAGAKS